ncbi:hypothetical protein L0Y46_04065 [bacterium]|nr:hypothetical protein [bacterium]
MKKTPIFIAIIIVLGAAGYFFMRDAAAPVSTVNTFDECAAAGHPVMESYPRQCHVPDGKTFIENIGNELEKSDLILIENPRPNQEIASPLTITGRARGTWFFEASFPIKLLDENGKEIAVYHAEAQSDWMTENFVPFKAVLTFTAPSEGKGTLVLMKDNPSGLPEHDDELRVPVRFGESETPPPLTSGEPKPNGDCVITGCSGQVCADEEAITTCEYRPEYACYQNAACERQTNGECGWTETPALASCIEGSRQNDPEVIY